MVVTVQPRHGSDVPDISSENVIVYQSHTRATVTQWVPLQGDRANLELFILLDDSRNTSWGSQVEDLRHFIMAQPATTKIGVAYMQIGGAKIVQGLTTDHKLAANALHVTLSNLAASVSPYFSLSDLLKQWLAGNDRREILMISNGIDGLYGNGDKGNEDDGYVDSAIEAAQRAGIVVFAVCSTGQNPESDRINLGIHHLSQVAEETGGESYYCAYGTAISLAPYLSDSTHRLARQYLLTFLAKPGKTNGMQPVKVRSELPHAELVSAQRVYVPAARQ
jgi:hypothetical protein